MAKKVFNMQGGLHSAAAYAAFENRAYGSCVANAASFVTTPGAGMNLNITSGDGLISVDAFLARRIQVTATETAAVSAANASFARLDTLVAYIDTAVAPTTAVIDNINDVLKFKVVPGTAAATPVAPTGAAIQASIGAGNPYVVLYDVLLPAAAVNVAGVTLTDRRKVITVVDVNNIPNASIGRSKIDVTTFPAAQSTTVKNASAKNMAVSETFYFSGADQITLTLAKPTAVLLNFSCAFIISGDSEFWLLLQNNGVNIHTYQPAAAPTAGPRANVRTTSWAGVLPAGTNVIRMGITTAGGAGASITAGSACMSALVGMPTTN